MIHLFDVLIKEDGEQFGHRGRNAKGGDDRRGAGLPASEASWEATRSFVRRPRHIPCPHKRSLILLTFAFGL